MTMQELRQALSVLVTKRARSPLFEGRLSQIDRAGSALNPYCGDAVSVVASLDATAARLSAVRCRVEGCALCRASADLMAECLQGRTLLEASQLDADFQRLLATGTCDWSGDHPLHSLSAFAALQSVPARSGCAALPWQALRQALSPDGSLRPGEQQPPAAPQ